MRELLQPRLRDWLGAHISVRLRTFQGKSDLLKNLPNRFAGYARTYRRNRGLRVLVLLDRDDDDCVKLKREIDAMARRAGLAVRGDSGSPIAMARIVVRELENWYFGDWFAVRKAFPKIPGEPPSRYRANPDADQAKTSLAFANLLTRVGAPDSKPEWARRIAPYLDPNRNVSPSFRTFLDGARELVGTDGPPRFRKGAERA